MQRSNKTPILGPSGESRRNRLTGARPYNGHRIGGKGAMVCSLAALALIPLMGTARAGSQPMIGVANLRPVEAPLHQPVSDAGTSYFPASPSSSTQMDRVSTAPQAAEVRALDVDLQIENGEGDYLRLDRVSVLYSGHGLDDVSLAGDELLAMPESLLTIPRGRHRSNTDGLSPKRAALTSGGFGVTGFLLERYLDRGGLLTGSQGQIELPFGRVLDVRSYLLGSAVRRTLVVGTRELLNESGLSDSSAHGAYVSQQGFLAKYNEEGVLEASVLAASTRLSALADLGDGRFLTAGTLRTGDGERLTLARYRLYAQGAGRESRAELEAIEPEDSFGGGKGLAVIGFPTARGGCEHVGAVNIEATTKDKYLVSAFLACGDERLGGLAAVDSRGNPIEAFGHAGALVFAGPEREPVRPVGAFESLGRWLYIGAAVGEGCFDFYAGTGCRFGLTRFDIHTGVQDAGFGWHVESMPHARSSMPYSMTRCPAASPFARDRFVLGGRALDHKGYETPVLMRFRSDGTLDPSFDGDGRLRYDFGGQGGFVKALALDASGRLAMAVESRETGPDGTVVSSFAAAQLDQNGGLIWWHRPYRSHRWTLRDVSNSASDGFRGARRVQSIPRAITVDDRGRILVVGLAAHPQLGDGPLAQAQPGAHRADSGEMMALARYLPIGVPDDRRWIRAGEKRGLFIPEDPGLRLEQATAGEIAVDLKFNGFEVTRIERSLGEPMREEGRSFPIHESGFAPRSSDGDEADVIRSRSPEQHQHQQQSSVNANRLAHDIHGTQWDGGRGLNAAYPMRVGQQAPNGNAEVVGCRRAYQDGSASEIPSADGNYLKVRCTRGSLYTSGEERPVLMQLQQDSSPDSFHAPECPDENPGCGVDSHG